MTIGDLTILYVRIRKGIATAEDITKFNIGVATSCIEKEFLMRMIEKEAHSIEHPTETGP